MDSLENCQQAYVRSRKFWVWTGVPGGWRFYLRRTHKSGVPVRLVLHVSSEHTAGAAGY